MQGREEAGNGNVAEEGNRKDAWPGGGSERMLGDVKDGREGRNWKGDRNGKEVRVRKGL